MSAKELKDKLKALRSEHMGKAIGKMSPEEIQKEIDHHETACRQRELKAKRLEALAKAREEKKAPVAPAVKSRASKSPEPPKKEPKEKKEKKEKKEEVKEVVKVKKEKKKVVMKSDSEESDTDSSSDTETIKSRIQKKKFANEE